MKTLSHSYEAQFSQIASLPHPHSMLSGNDVNIISGYDMDFTLTLTLADLLDKLKDSALDGFFGNLISNPPVARWLGKQPYITGYYLDFTEDKNKKVLFGALLKIEYKNGEYHVVGTKVRADGKMFANFKSFNARLVDQRLIFDFIHYEGTEKSLGWDDLFINFDAKFYTGFYAVGKGAICSIQGNLVSAEVCRQYNNFKLLHNIETFIYDSIQDENCKRGF